MTKITVPIAWTARPGLGDMLMLANGDTAFYDHANQQWVITRSDQAQPHEPSEPKPEPVFTEEDAMEAGTMRMCREFAQELGYDDVLAALEDLAEYRQKEATRYRVTQEKIREEKSFQLTRQQEIERGYELMIMELQQAAKEADAKQVKKKRR